MLTKDTLIQLLSGLPVESVSLDNGSEFSEFHTMEQELNAPVYFAEPHKPWQRGTNENTNGILRFYFPKGCDFRNVTQDELDAVVRQINARPRKCLGWRTHWKFFLFLCCSSLTICRVRSAGSGASGARSRRRSRYANPPPRRTPPPTDPIRNPPPKQRTPQNMRTTRPPSCAVLSFFLRRRGFLSVFPVRLIE